MLGVCVVNRQPVACAEQQVLLHCQVTVHDVVLHRHVDFTLQNSWGLQLLLGTCERYEANTFEAWQAEAKPSIALLEVNMLHPQVQTSGTVKIRMAIKNCMATSKSTPK